MGRMRATSLSCAGLLGVALASSCSPGRQVQVQGSPAPRFLTTTVDPHARAGQAAITIDAQGAAHVSYYEQATATLRYATNASGAWSFATVDDDGDVGRSNAIALDSADAPRIVYHDASNQRLKLAQLDAGLWTTSIVTEDGAPGPALDLIRGTNGRLQLAYTCCYEPPPPPPTTVDATRALVVAELTDSGWAMSTIKRIGVPNATSSGAVSLSQNALGTLLVVHTSYFGWWGTTHLHVGLRLRVGGWATVQPDLSLISGLGASARIDDQEHLHFAFTGITYGSLVGPSGPGLKYVSSRRGSWEYSSLVSDGYLASLVLDSSGRPSIVYGTQSLVFATEVAGVWQIEIVDPSGIVMGPRAAECDADGRVHIAYTDPGSGALEYASVARR